MSRIVTRLGGSRLAHGKLIGYDGGMKLRFSIRELFWLILVVALSFGWWKDRHQSEAELDRLYVKDVTVRAIAADTSDQTSDNKDA